MGFLDLGIGDIAGFGAIATAVSDVVGLFQSPDSGPKRADWARLDLMQKAAAAQQSLFAQPQGILPGGPAFIPAVFTPPARVQAQPPVRQDPAFRFPTGMSPMLGQDMDRQDRDTRTLKDLISIASLGISEKALRDAARENKFTLNSFRMIVGNPAAMMWIWTAMGGKWNQAASQFERAWILSLINRALKGTGRRKRRMMSLRTMERAASQAKRWEKALKKMGTIKKPCFDKHAHKVTNVRR